MPPGPLHRLLYSAGGPASRRKAPFPKGFLTPDNVHLRPVPAQTVPLWSGVRTKNLGTGWTGSGSGLGSRRSAGGRANRGYPNLPRGVAIVRYRRSYGLGIDRIPFTVAEGMRWLFWFPNGGRQENAGRAHHEVRLPSPASGHGAGPLQPHAQELRERPAYSPWPPGATRFAALMGSCIRTGNPTRGSCAAMQLHDECRSQVASVQEGGVRIARLRGDSASSPWSRE